MLQSQDNRRASSVRAPLSGGPVAVCREQVLFETRPVLARTRYSFLFPFSLFAIRKEGLRICQENLKGIGNLEYTFERSNGNGRLVAGV